MEELKDRTWIELDSRRLAWEGADRKAVAECLIQRMPRAERIPGIREKLRRESYSLRPQINRPRGWSIAATFSRAFLGTTSLIIVAYLLFNSGESSQWTGDGFSRPNSEAKFLVGAILFGIFAVGVQVIAEFRNLKAEREAEVERSSLQIEIFFERAVNFVEQFHTKQSQTKS